VSTDKISDVGGVLCIELVKIAGYAESLIGFDVVIHHGTLETSLKDGLAALRRSQDVGKDSVILLHLVDAVDERVPRYVPKSRRSPDTAPCDAVILLLD
jgi:hypothetical protein